MKLSKNRVILGAYMIASAIFFLYVLFPSNAIKEYLAYRLSEVVPDLKVKIAQATPVFPAGIKLQHIGFYHRDAGIGSLESIKVTAGISGLFRPGAVYSFKGRAYSGELSGKAQIAADLPVPDMTVDTTLTSIQINEIPGLQKLSAYKLAGTLDGKIAYISKASNRTLNGNFTLSDCRVDLPTPVFNQGFLTFRDVKTDLVLSNGELTVKRCSLAGNQLDADISGSISLNGSYGRNRLSLTATIKPHHVLLAKIEKNLPLNFLRGGKGLSFKINGTLDAPEFSFN
jgi:type II secretion system protein N